jgi:predicted enzyme related to lactoylglutathione lyase
MAEFTPPPHGTVCWRELQTPKLAECKEFYTELLGWHLEQSKHSPVEYPEIHVDGVAHGGMLEINESWGQGWENYPAVWSTYIAVDDCDATHEAIKANGGSIICQPFDAPNVGRVCIAMDPFGAAFTVIQFLKP